jgi:hypothetical protein
MAKNTQSIPTLAPVAALDTNSADSAVIWQKIVDQLMTPVLKIAGKL